MDNTETARALLKMAKELVAAPADDLKRAVEAASSFMNVGAELKKARIKYSFSTEMIPIYMVKIGGDTYAITNKKNVSDPDYVVGNIAVGKL